MDPLPIPQSLLRVASDWNAAPPRRAPFKDFNERPITARKCAFVDDCLIANDSLDRVMHRHHLSPRELAGWLTEMPFRVHLHRVCRTLTKRRVTTTPETMRTNQSRYRAIIALVRFARDSEMRQLQERAPAPRPLDAIVSDHSKARALQMQTHQFLTLLEGSTFRR